MKRIMFLATFAVASLTSVVNAKNVAVESSESSETTQSVKCYRKAVDDFGNTYYVRVDCPKTLVIVSN